MADFEDMFILLISYSRANEELNYDTLNNYNKL